MNVSKKKKGLRCDFHMAKCTLMYCLPLPSSDPEDIEKFSMPRYLLSGLVIDISSSRGGARSRNAGAGREQEQEQIQEYEQSKRRSSPVSRRRSKGTEKARAQKAEKVAVRGPTKVGRLQYKVQCAVEMMLQHDRLKLDGVARW